MRCFGCSSPAEGYAVIPGIGEWGEIRFFCDPCARRHVVKMRYWDGRDLEIGGWRENPDLGPSFQNLVFGFQDVVRMRREDLERVLEWLDDEELALALTGADAVVVEKIYSVLPLGRLRRIRDLLDRGDLRGTATAPSPEAARDLVVSIVRRL